MLRKYQQILLILATTLLFTACSVKQPAPIAIKSNDIDVLASTANDNAIDSTKDSKDFFEKYFKPWNSTKVSFPKVEAMWGQSYKLKKVYLENHLLATPEWFDKQIENSNFDAYNTLTKKAIILKNTNIRVLPTNSPMFYDPTKPGEGFPFDYNQNSAIKINTPIIVSHLSKDKAWAYMESSNVGGWVEIGTIAFVDEKFIQEFKTSNYFVSVKEKFPIYDPIFREYVKVATIFPKKNNKYIIAKRDDNQNALISYIDLNVDEVEPMPLAFNTQNRIKIAKQLLDEPYGWGGLLNNRDCSSFTQDYFATFGKYLHRNSKAQLSNGKYLDMSKLSNDEKKEFIRKNGVPFSTLVYLKGHIMLYIGIKEKEPLVLHDMWSVRLKDSNGVNYRHIVGKTSITTLEPGIGMKDYNEDSNILNRILGIVVL
ncbi:MAG: SH3 domain-containing protein [Aliarcobacter sp.]|nr:SH3 domain-containing protein [Aliarcobacter sp.]MDD2887746.1 SH3 domain-containing protein [Aliarcobacter sp.]